MSDDLATQRDIAVTFGVTVNQVHMWHKRRETTGFPAPVASVLRPVTGRPRGPMFVMDEVVQWRVGYDANRNRGRHWARKREVGR